MPCLKRMGWMWSDLVLSCETFITKTHFLCSLVLGTSNDSDTT